MTEEVRDERELRLAFGAKDEQAIREVYRLYGKAIFGIALRILRDRSVAEEAVQTTFVKAWVAAEKLDPDKEIGPWLYTIARRVAIDMYRKETRHRSTEVKEADIAVLPTEMENAWDAWQVRVAVSKLPPDDQELIRCFHYLGLSQSETAEKMGLPLGTIKSRSSRAHAKLATMLSYLREESA